MGLPNFVINLLSNEHNTLMHVVFCLYEKLTSTNNRVYTIFYRQVMEAYQFLILTLHFKLFFLSAVFNTLETKPGLALFVLIFNQLIEICLKS